MSKSGVTVQLSVKEIYDQLCPKCKKRMRHLIKERITDKMVTNTLGGE